MGSGIEKYKTRLDKFSVGIVSGLVGLIIGFVIIGTLWGLLEGESLSFFIEVAFIKAPMYRVRILTASGIFDVLLFFYFFQNGFLNFCKGMLGVLLIAVLAILILY
jgi:hypothetical protein